MGVITLNSTRRICDRDLLSRAEREKQHVEKQLEPSIFSFLGQDDLNALAELLAAAGHKMLSG